MALILFKGESTGCMTISHQVSNKGFILLSRNNKSSKSITTESRFESNKANKYK